MTTDIDNRNISYSVLQCICFMMAFSLTFCFMMRYYFAVLHTPEKTSNFFDKLSQKYGSDFTINNVWLISTWKVKKIDSKKEISSLNLALISIILSYVTILFFIVEKFTDGKILTTYPSGILSSFGLLIGFCSKIAFKYSTVNHLTSILHNSIYQVSSKSIKLTHAVNTIVLVIFLPFWFITGASINGLKSRFGVISVTLFTLAQMAWIIIVVYLYYTKLGKIINDLNDYSHSRRGRTNQKRNGNEKRLPVTDLQWMNNVAQSSLFDKLVQSITVNILFVSSMLIEVVFGMVYVNIEDDVEEATKMRDTVICMSMVAIICFNSLQASFNVAVYQKGCKICHNCCVKSMRRWLYTRKSAVIDQNS